jgi:hypothetical protein
MWRPTRRLIDVMADATVGTAIVLFHVMLTESRAGRPRRAIARRSTIDDAVARE